MTVTAKFIDGGRGKILITVHEPSAGADHAVVVLPAFGDEMNKSRRLVWSTAKRLAGKGYLVVVPDLFGTGDSEGDFADADWETWILDLRSAIDWARTRGATKISALAVRFGATFLSSMSVFVGFERVVSWQPVANGSEVLRDMIRVKSLNLRMAGHATMNAADMLHRLCNGKEPLELSGYLISSQLGTEICSAEFSHEKLSMRDRSMVVGFRRRDDATGEEIQLARNSDQMRLEVFVGGERFWRVAEPGANDELVSMTTQFFPSV